MWQNDLLRCPVCKGHMVREGNSLFCDGARRHCFDFSKEGYVNLAPSKASGGGDDSLLIRSRTAFLSGGHYAPFADRICSLLREHAPGGTVIDAGCGEGYYTCRMAESGFRVFGLDLSKNGVKHAAKAAARMNADAFFAVAGIFDLPVQDGAADAVVSLFAPVCEQEFWRVLKPGGILLLAGAGPKHLHALKEVLYDHPYQNQPRADAPRQMRELASKRFAFDMELDANALQSLFAMTPYFYRTPESGRARLTAQSLLTVGAEIDITVYQKQ